VSLAVGPAISFITKALYPLTYPTQLFINATLRLFGVRVVNQPGAEESLEELRGAIDLHSESAEEIREAGAMLHSILDLDEVPVADIMTHRRNVTMIDADQSAEAIVAEALASPHTRIPLYRGDPDNVAGVLHAKALLRAIQSNGWRVEGLDIVGLSAAPWFIPGGTSLLNQLEAFKDRREHFAIVVDEYGAMMGVVTLEDIIEEIVGDITDEHDQHVRGVVAEPTGSYLVDGNVTIRDLHREFDWNLPDEAASTLAGLVLHEARQIPVPGQVFMFYGLRLEILDRQRNQIRRIRVTPVRDTAPAATAPTPPLPRPASDAPGEKQ
jgi:Mg2+/Co2+ transporter CorB